MKRLLDEPLGCPIEQFEKSQNARLLFGAQAKLNVWCKYRIHETYIYVII